jgi:DNA-binding response OmpR family regulator
MADKKILVVEDSEPLRKVIAEMLREEHFDVLEANGGEEGLRIAAEKKPDLIITDIVMFPMDGLEMAKQIRTIGLWGEGVDIIALTNQNTTDSEDRLKDLKLTAYLVKADTGLTEVVKCVKDVFKKKA